MRLYSVGYGQFIYYEATHHPVGEVATFATDARFPVSHKYCVQFYLNMFAGIHDHEMGSLSVYVTQKGNTQQPLFTHIFQKDGVTGNQSYWKEVNIDVQLNNMKNVFVVRLF